MFKNKIAVATACEPMLTKAKELASQLNLPLVTYNHIAYAFLLAVTPKRLELQDRRVKNSKPIYVDFLSSGMDYRAKSGGGGKQLIAKAAGVKSGVRPMVLDATAGFGTDAFVLASLGCEVVMLERSPIIGALLKDGLERFRKHPKGEKLKISLYILQAVEYMQQVFCGKLEKPDVVYLDPMYPRRLKAALGKKAMRVLQEIVGKDEDAAEMLIFALKCAKKRVVVKRPSCAQSLGLLKPDLEFSLGGSCRYDVYFSAS